MQAIVDWKTEEKLHIVKQRKLPGKLPTVM